MMWITSLGLARRWHSHLPQTQFPRPLHKMALAGDEEFIPEVTVSPVTSGRQSFWLIRSKSSTKHSQFLPVRPSWHLQMPHSKSPPPEHWTKFDFESVCKPNFLKSNYNPILIRKKKNVCFFLMIQFATFFWFSHLHWQTIPTSRVNVSFNPTG